MAQNNKLKRQAQAFAQKHSVPYLTALKAVDEPLHELRDLTSPSAMAVPQLRLTGEKSIYQPIQSDRLFDEELSWFNAYQTRQEMQDRIGARLGLKSPREIRASEQWKTFVEEWGSEVVSPPSPRKYQDLIRDNGWDHFDASANNFGVFEELGRRSAVLRSAAVDTVWEYRELQRAGLLPANSDSLEILPFYHDGGSSFEILKGDGADLGLICVAVKNYAVINAERYIPVSESQLASLLEGRVSGIVDFWRPVKERRSYDVGFIAEAKPSAYAPNVSMLVFFTEGTVANAEQAQRKIYELGIDQIEFRFSSFPGLEIDCYESGTGTVRIINRTNAQEIYSGLRDGVLFL